MMKQTWSSSLQIMKKTAPSQRMASRNGVKNGIGRVSSKRSAKAQRNYRSGGLRGSIVVGDCLLFLRSLQAESADIVFLDPPFNLGKKYCGRRPRLDVMSDAKYQEW